MSGDRARFPGGTPLIRAFTILLTLKIVKFLTKFSDSWRVGSCLGAVAPVWLAALPPCEWFASAADRAGRIVNCTMFIPKPGIPTAKIKKTRKIPRTVSAAPSSGRDAEIIASGGTSAPIAADQVERPSGSA